MAAFTLHDGYVLVSVRLTPKAHDDRIDGIKRLSDGKAVLVARVRALPSEGAANMALAKLLALAAGVPKSAVEIAAGHSQRVKIVRIAGEPAAIVAALGGSRGAGKAVEP